MRQALLPSRRKELSTRASVCTRARSRVQPKQILGRHNHAPAGSHTNHTSGTLPSVRPQTWHHTNIAGKQSQECWASSAEPALTRQGGRPPSVALNPSHEQQPQGPAPVRCTPTPKATPAVSHAHAPPPHPSVASPSLNPRHRGCVRRLCLQMLAHESVLHMRSPSNPHLVPFAVLLWVTSRRCTVEEGWLERGKWHREHASSGGLCAVLNFVDLKPSRDVQGWGVLGMGGGACGSGQRPTVGAPTLA